ncbi:MAG: DUF1214 domain-containing protein [Bosea sp. (in: a-proteobacteria)]|uniref:DUF1214 domain-containing protein n=1 Tax=Bosea sp. (in: a-proteobacteria) TaxID=1871050 RepID=UPI002734CF96|nr:DUF1214 domain-containing protein [Bosea sp. (in: a-proteobacteria)]MDP3256511.1 DUF1214 domain-containing protein [Bosea sp. (in: a-proteobacteria)]MDP3318460.1 DUF1214 domain-containing protein [Bosea sp. (in: a-proteobacteria)]
MRVFHLAYVIALGAGLGLASAHFAVAGRPLLGMVEIGPWAAWPRSGSRDIDPYLRAYLARGVHLPLGAGEGLELIAERDDEGRGLDGRCRYRLTGQIPTTRGWTLSVTDTDGRNFRLPLDRNSFTDAEVVRAEDGGLRIAAASWPQPGDWLPLPASGRFQFRLRLYDTPIAAQAGETRAESLPRIARMDCS